MQQGPQPWRLSGNPFAPQLAQQVPTSPGQNLVNRPLAKAADEEVRERAHRYFFGVRTATLQELREEMRKNSEKQPMQDAENTHGSGKQAHDQAHDVAHDAQNTGDVSQACAASNRDASNQATVPGNEKAAAASTRRSPFSAIALTAASKRASVLNMFNMERSGTGQGTKKPRIMPKWYREGEEAFLSDKELYFKRSKPRNGLHVPFGDMSQKKAGSPLLDALGVRNMAATGDVLSGNQPMGNTHYGNLLDTAARLRLRRSGQSPAIPAQRPMPSGGSFAPGALPIKQAFDLPMLAALPAAGAGVGGMFGAATAGPGNRTRGAIRGAGGGLGATLGGGLGLLGGLYGGAALEGTHPNLAKLLVPALAFTGGHLGMHAGTALADKVAPEEENGEQSLLYGDKYASNDRSFKSSSAMGRLGGTLLGGAGIGALLAPKGHRAEGAGRGVGYGLGEHVGATTGAAGGLGLLALLLKSPRMLGAVSKIPGLTTAMGFGAATAPIAGAVGGTVAAHKLMGPPSWKKASHEKEALIPQLLGGAIRGVGMAGRAAGGVMRGGSALARGTGSLLAAPGRALNMAGQAGGAIGRGLSGAGKYIDDVGKRLMTPPPAAGAGQQALAQAKALPKTIPTPAVNPASVPMAQRGGLNRWSQKPNQMATPRGGSTSTTQTYIPGGSPSATTQTMPPNMAPQPFAQTKPVSVPPPPPPRAGGADAYGASLNAKAVGPVPRRPPAVPRPIPVAKRLPPQGPQPGGGATPAPMPATKPLSSSQTQPQAAAQPAGDSAANWDFLRNSSSFWTKPIPVQSLSQGLPAASMAANALQKTSALENLDPFALAFLDKCLSYNLTQPQFELAVKRASAVHPDVAEALEPLTKEAIGGFLNTAKNLWNAGRAGFGAARAGNAGMAAGNAMRFGEGVGQAANAIGRTTSQLGGVGRTVGKAIQPYTNGAFGQTVRGGLTGSALGYGVDAVGDVTGLYDTGGMGSAIGGAMGMGFRNPFLRKAMHNAGYGGVANAGKKFFTGGGWINPRLNGTGLGTAQKGLAYAGLGAGGLSAVKGYAQNQGVNAAQGALEDAARRSGFSSADEMIQFGQMMNGGDVMGMLQHGWGKLDPTTRMLIGGGGLALGGGLLSGAMGNSGLATGLGLGGAGAIGAGLLGNRMGLFGGQQPQMLGGASNPQNQIDTLDPGTQPGSQVADASGMNTFEPRNELQMQTG